MENKELKFREVVENYMADMYELDRSDTDWVEMSPEDFLRNFDRDLEALEASIMTLVNYGCGKYPEHIKKMWDHKTLTEMATFIKENWV